MTAIDLDGYLARIGHAGSRRPDLATLQAIHFLHPQAIPFENLDPFLGRVVDLDLAAIQRKLLAGGRGGYCFEHNLLLLHVLRALGFEADGLAARVMWNQPAGALMPRSHMLLRVRLDGQDWLADVGFGGLTLTAPLRLLPGPAQPTPHEPVRLVPDGEELILAAELGGTWQPLYRFDLRPQLLPDYEVASWYLCTHPRSQFRARLMIARATANGRLALLDDRLTMHHRAGLPERRRLASIAALREALAGPFGLDLPSGPALDQALARLLAAAG
jgi:N-hydroxyarylamine O-acetyltransferase